MEEFEKEDRALKPYILFTIRDEQGNVVRKLKASASAGMKRIVWDFRYPSTGAIRKSGGKNTFANEGGGLPVVPGNYTVEMAKVLGDEITPIGNKQSFVCRSLYNQRLAADPATQKLKLEMQEMNRIFSGVNQEFRQLIKQADLVKLALKATPNSTPEMMKQALAVEQKLDSLNTVLYGNESLSKRFEASPPSLNSRLSNAIYNSWGTHEPPTQTQIDDFKIVQNHIGEVQQDLKNIKADLLKLDAELDKIKAAYTPGRN
jgi:chromosome segregation ATPase